MRIEFENQTSHLNGCVLKSWGVKRHYHKYIGCVSDPCGLLHALELWFWTKRRAWRLAFVFGEAY